MGVLKIAPDSHFCVVQNIVQLVPVGTKFVDVANTLASSPSASNTPRVCLSRPLRMNTMLLGVAYCSFAPSRKTFGSSVLKNINTSKINSNFKRLWNFFHHIGAVHRWVGLVRFLFLAGLHLFSRKFTHISSTTKLLCNLNRVRKWTFLKILTSNLRNGKFIRHPRLIMLTIVSHM